MPSGSGTTAAGLICPAGITHRLRRGYGRPQLRSHAGPWIQFSITFLLTRFGLTGTVRDRATSVIFGISLFHNESITARSQNYFCRSNAPFRHALIRLRSWANCEPNHANFVSWDTYLRWRTSADAVGTQRGSAMVARRRGEQQATPGSNSDA